jgi:hypothetical protein
MQIIYAECHSSHFINILGWSDDSNMYNLNPYFPDTTSYSLRFGKRSRLGQQHGLQNTILTSHFYKNIY